MAEPAGRDRRPRLEQHVDVGGLVVDQPVETGGNAVVTRSPKSRDVDESVEVRPGRRIGMVGDDDDPVIARRVAPERLQREIEAVGLRVYVNADHDRRAWWSVGGGAGCGM